MVRREGDEKVVPVLLSDLGGYPTPGPWDGVGEGIAPDFKCHGTLRWLAGAEQYNTPHPPPPFPEFDYKSQALAAGRLSGWSNINLVTELD